MNHILVTIIFQNISSWMNNMFFPRQMIMSHIPQLINKKMVLSDYDGPLGLNLALHWQKKKGINSPPQEKQPIEPVWAHRLVIVMSILPIILITELFSGVWSITSG